MRTPAAGSAAPAESGSSPAAAPAETRASQSIAASQVGRQSVGAPAAAQLGPYTWRQDVTAITDTGDGAIRVDPVNPRQFATEESAQALASGLGLKSFGLNLAGFTRYSSDVQMLNVSGNSAEAALNAGLVADTLSKYGSEPGSYGRYLIDRDLAMLRGEAIRDPYANS